MYIHMCICIYIYTSYSKLKYIDIMHITSMALMDVPWDLEDANPQDQGGLADQHGASVSLGSYKPLEAWV